MTSRQDDIAAQVEARAKALEGEPRLPDISPVFIRQCLDSNERGDGCLYAALHKDHFLYNTTPKDGEWLCWQDVVWKPDQKTKRSFAAVEDCALAYQSAMDTVREEIETENIDPKGDGAWKIKLADKYQKRIDRLRSVSGAQRTLTWAPVVEPSMACEDGDFDNHPWLLPCANGVINLQTGAIEAGRPEDRLTRALDLVYNPTADYSLWVRTLDEITGDPEITAFLKRSFGYALTGFASEQYIWIFTGPGRNGKGIIFSMIGSVLGPYYHEINRGMILEQRNEPSPAAASEHKYSLLGKRLIVGAETNKGQRIDAAAIKALTGEDLITCRPLFRAEVSFHPTHTLFLHTNHLPYGLTKDFAMVQRILKVEFPFMYVDDIEAEQKKSPGQAPRFRQKDPFLKNKLKEHRQGILRWLVEGCLEWQQVGLQPPQSIIDGVNSLAKDEDFIGQFIDDCLVHLPDEPDQRLSCTAMYDCFKWWRSQNMDTNDKKLPAMKSINTAIRDRGYRVEKAGGKTWIYANMVNPEVVQDVNDYLAKNKERSF